MNPSSMPCGAAEPKPSKRFAKRFVLNARLLAHLPDCEACRATISYLVSESDKLRKAKLERRDDYKSRPN
jgi:hypothetical protein